ncbi:MAG: hypothetical protein AB1Z57_03395 [Acidimicrobiia bacterium]
MALLTVPDTLPETRRSLHLVLFYAVSLARQRVDGEVWAVPMPGGFGVLFDGTTLRVDGVDLVEERAGLERRREAITTLDAAMAFAGVDFDRARGERNDVEVPEWTDEELAADGRAAVVLAEWFQLGWEVLGRVLERAGWPADTERRLWNEHFDLAIEVGSEADERRAAVGFSPGDAEIPEPYAYVAPWFRDEAAERLVPTHSFGVAITHSDVADAADPAGEVERFLTQALERLGAV